MTAGRGNRSVFPPASPAFLLTVTQPPGKGNAAPECGPQSGLQSGPEVRTKPGPKFSTKLEQLEAAGSFGLGASFFLFYRIKEKSK
jgi:hypothetical protein